MVLYGLEGENGFRKDRQETEKRNKFRIGSYSASTPRSFITAVFNTIAIMILINNRTP